MRSNRKENENLLKCEKKRKEIDTHSMTTSEYESLLFNSKTKKNEEKKVMKLYNCVSSVFITVDN